MTPKGIREDVSLPLPSDNREEEKSASGTPPKLTMKLLNERLNMLQQENLGLHSRIANLEQQMDAFVRSWNESAAAAMEVLAPTEAQGLSAPFLEAAELEAGMPGKPAVTENFPLPDATQETRLIPRSLRHPKKQRKKSIFSLFLVLFGLYSLKE